MTNKERYSEWVAKQEYVPISMMPWWLDAVCAGKTWDVLFAEDEKGKIVGAMPYLIRKRAWMKYILMPPLSQAGGIWVAPENGFVRSLGVRFRPIIPFGTPPYNWSVVLRSGHIVPADLPSE